MPPNAGIYLPKSASFLAGCSDLLDFGSWYPLNLLRYRKWFITKLTMIFNAACGFRMLVYDAT